MMRDALLAPAPLYQYLTVALVTPLGVPCILGLLNKWRLSRAGLAWLTAGVLGFTLVFTAAVYALLGNSTPALVLVGSVPPILTWAVYIAASRLRGGRLLFGAITAYLLVMANQAVAHMLAPASTLLWVIVKVALSAAEVLILYYLCRAPFSSMLGVPGVGWVRLSVLPLSLTACLMVGYVNTVSVYDTRSAVLAAILCLSGALIYVTLYRLIIGMQARARADREAALLRSQMRYMQQQTGLVLAGERKTRAFRHDMRHFTSLLKGCVAAGDLASVDEVVGNLEQVLDAVTSPYALRGYTGNPMLDAVFSLAAETAQAEGIAFEARLDPPEALAADMVQLAVVVTNALENALNACCAQPQGEARSVRVTGAIQGLQYFLSVENTFSGSIRFSEDTGLPATQQQDHGYGTQSIASFARENDAILSCVAEEGWFKLGLLLPRAVKGGG